MLSYRCKENVHRFIEIMLTETRTSSIFLGYFGILLGIGFILGSSTSHGYSFITNYLAASYWAVGFIFYGTIKLIQSILRVPPWLRLFNSLQGMWSWSFILLSVFIFNNDTFLPGQVVFLYPLILELWELSVYIFNIKLHRRRDTDTWQ